MGGLCELRWPLMLATTATIASSLGAGCGDSGETPEMMVVDVNAAPPTVNPMQSTGGTFGATGGTGAGQAAPVGGTGVTVPSGGMPATGGTMAPPVAGAAGMMPTGGTGSAPATGDCGITADAMLSSAIPTVGIVTFSTDMPSMDSARIEFGLAETGPTMEAPVDLEEPDLRTLLLGMKAGRDYVYRIVVEQGGSTCTSEDFMLTTGQLPGGAPSVTRQLMAAGSESTGFIVTSTGANFGGGFGGGGLGGGGAYAYIFDTDGDVVWFAEAPTSPSRAHMSFDGKDMWMMELNVDNGGGEMRRISMDGLDEERNISGLASGHHDFTVLPGGGVAVPIWSSGLPDGPNSLIERSPDGTITTVVADISSLYVSVGYHPNAIHYHPEDDSYTISDRNPNLFVKVSRQGQLLWQLGGQSPLGNHFPGDWQVNHGHHLLDNGNFVFYNNGSGFGGSSAVIEYALDESTWTATEVFRYQTSMGSPTLGDAERLPNGNTLATHSNSGVMEEVGPSGNVIQRFSAGSFGYADFRESLYGPPPR